MGEKYFNDNYRLGNVDSRVVVIPTLSHSVGILVIGPFPSKECSWIFFYLGAGAQPHRINLFPLLGVLPRWIHVIKFQAEKAGGSDKPGTVPLCSNWHLCLKKSLVSNCTELLCLAGHSFSHARTSTWMPPLLSPWLPWNPHFSHLSQLLTLPQQLTRSSLLWVMETFRPEMRLFGPEIFISGPG